MIGLTTQLLTPCLVIAARARSYYQHTISTTHMILDDEEKCWYCGHAGRQPSSSNVLGLYYTLVENNLW
jgi:hypothetical protein